MKDKRKIKRYLLIGIVIILLLLPIGGMSKALITKASAREEKVTVQEQVINNNVVIGGSPTASTENVATDNPTGTSEENSTTSLNYKSMKCTFYDYYSDSQVTASSEPGKITDAIVENKNTFTRLNRRLLDTKKYADSLLSPAKWPIYMGLFQYHIYGGNIIDMAFYTDETESKNFDTNFWLGVNWPQTNGLAVATQGLVDTKLDSQGYLTQSNPTTGKSCRVPFFDKEFLMNTKHTGSQLALGEVKEKVFFPLIESKQNGVTYYSFDSSKDTVVFNDNGQLDYLGENNGQVLDYYDAPGFFPYNVTAEGNSESLNFGFGVKMEADFTMTEDGKIDGENMVFRFSGDDDLWVFIDGYLVLDVGGIHPPVHGMIDFVAQSSNVNAVKNNTIAFSQKEFMIIDQKDYSVEEMLALGIADKTTSEPGFYFNHGTDFPQGLKESLKDTTKSHKMTIFYMERGKGSSNLKITFNMPILEKDSRSSIRIINGDVLD